MGLWTQALFTGLSVGVVYGVVGVGYVLVHRITGMVNFAQGDTAMAGAFGAVVAASVLPVPVAVLGGALVGGLVGLVVYRFAVHPLRNHGLLVQTIVTLGAAIVLRSVAQLVFGTKPYALAPLTEGGPLRLAGASISVQALWLLGVMLVLYLALAYFFDRTMTGRALAACAANREAAGVVGINVTTMATVAFCISGLVTGLVGALQVPLTFITAGAGLALGMKGFIAAILGGFDRIGLTMVGGLLVGILEAVAAATISSSYQDVVVLALMLVLLIARPAGLARIRVTQRA